jgi:ankyrin repeat protein
MDKMDTSCLKSIASNDFILFKELISNTPDSHLLEQYLYMTCIYENEPMVRHLLTQQVCPNNVHFHTYPMRSIARIGNIAIAQALFDHGALLELPHSMYTEYYTAPIIEACENDQNDMVKWLISNKANILTQNMTTIDTPLHIACRRKNDSLVEYILSQDNSDLSVLNGEHLPALQYAMKPNRLSTLEILLKYGIARHVRICAHMIFDATHVYNYSQVFEFIKRFIQYGYSINNRAHCEPPLLSYFVRSKNIHFVKYILEHDDTCNLNITSMNDDTPLHVACTYQLIDMVKLLLQYHPDLDVQNSCGDTPLGIACSLGNVPLVHTLLHHGATSHMNPSTLFKSIPYLSVDIMNLLFQYGTNPLQLYEGKTLRQLMETEYESKFSVDLFNVLTDAEYAALSTPETWLSHLMSRIKIDLYTWYTILTPTTKEAFHHTLQDDEIDQRACYTAFHEGEDDALRRYRSGEEVNFSSATIRCIGRAQGARHLRKRYTSYLVYPEKIRKVLRECREF